MALSTAEAEYVAAGSSCSQLVWMKQMLKEYDVEQDALTLYCDNMSAINISKNPVQHRTPSAFVSSTPTKSNYFQLPRIRPQLWIGPHSSVFY